jgi:hypothetical protein
MLEVCEVDDLGDVYINYEDSGRTYFRRAMFINILLIVFGAIISIFFLFDFIVLIVLGILALTTTIIYLVHFLIVNKPMET